MLPILPSLCPDCLCLDSTLRPAPLLYGNPEFSDALLHAKKPTLSPSPRLYDTNREK